MKSRLQEKYRSETVPTLMKRFGWKNVMAVPKLQKITVNIGMGEASQNVKLLDTAAQELGQITGQKAVITRAKKSIANFKIRRGMPIGCAVTLRGDHMYEFLDRLCNVVLPRVRDFRGLPQNSFDGRGNYTLRSEEHTSALQSPDRIVCRLLLAKKIQLRCGFTPAPI